MKTASEIIKHMQDLAEGARVLSINASRKDALIVSGLHATIEALAWVIGQNEDYERVIENCAAHAATTRGTREPALKVRIAE